MNRLMIATEPLNHCGGLDKNDEKMPLFCVGVCGTLTPSSRLVMSIRLEISALLLSVEGYLRDSPGDESPSFT
jgi:hypothetical protein